MDGVNLTIEGVPESVYQRLKVAADERGLSLNAYLAMLLADEARMFRTREERQKSFEELQQFLKTQPHLSDSTELIREMRDA